MYGIKRVKQICEKRYGTVHKQTQGDHRIIQGANLADPIRITRKIWRKEKKKRQTMIQNRTVPNLIIYDIYTFLALPSWSILQSPAHSPSFMLESTFKVSTVLFTPMLWVRTGFKADPDPAVYLNSDPDQLFPQCGSMQIGILVRLCFT
jgi:hypothetical protein